MKYLIETTDASSLEPVEYDRVVFDSTVGGVSVKKGEEPQPTYEYVDLGLPSGLKWAKCNMGATTETEYGDYYQWGSVTPNTDTVCDWAHAPFNNGSSDYDDTYFTAHKSEFLDGYVLKPEYDAAHVNMGGSWRMPSYSDIGELLDNTNHEWTTINDINGRKFTSKTDSSKYIFIPASGYRGNTKFRLKGEQGHVWSTMVDCVSPYEVFPLRFGLDFCDDDYPYARFIGCIIRPVCS